MIVGDLNTEFALRNLCNTIALSQFIASECLKLCLFADLSTISYTFRSTVSTHSLIDHFIVTEGLSDYLLTYKQIESVDNLSDHLLVPIAFHLICNIEYANQNMLLDFEIVISVIVCVRHTLMQTTGI